ncbi:MAG: SpoIIE family protein phosphatase [Bacteroidetes bacterium]|nr:SpoIIE family protein phosphatase [Bacteroidota bacterium]
MRAFIFVPCYKVTCLLLCVFPLWSFAQEVLPLKANPVSEPLGLHMEELKDPDGTLTLEQARRRTGWQPSTQRVINKGFNLDHWWFRFRLQNTTDRERSWLVSVGWPVLTQVDFYDGTSVYHTGESRPFDGRPIAHRDYVFPVVLKAGETREFYFHTWSKAPSVYPFRVYSRDTFEENNQLDLLLMALYLGAVIIMVIYNVLLFLSVRDNSYLPYIFYLLSSIVFILSYRGVGYQYIWTDWVWLNVFTRVGLAAFSMLCLATFARRFLHTKERAPRHHKALGVVQWVAVYIMAAMLFQHITWLYFVTDILLNLLVGALPVISFLTALKVYRQGYRPAGYYLLAFSVFLPGLVIQILKNLAVLDQNLFTEYSFQFGIVLEQAILSLALGDRINVIKDEKEAAQAEAIAALQANEKLIAEQNRVLEHKVAERTEELQATLEVVEAKNKDILESIRYARRIQMSILPEDTLLARHLPDSFVFYRPKDIVSGDFYWFTWMNGTVFIAAVDCTGHGVPGAFMSVIGYNLLNRIINEQGITDPGAVLTALDAGVRAALKQDDGQHGQDGMDLILCALQPGNPEVAWASAQRPLWQARAGELIEYKGDKFPIGGSRYADKQFVTQRVMTQPGDVLYLLTDGYGDQFGGERGRKYGTRQLKDFLLGIASAAPEAQREALIAEYDQWRGNTAQIDDVTAIGLCF